MLTAYMRRLILGYLANIAARVRHRSPEGRELVKWVLNAADDLKLPVCSGKAQSHEDTCRDGEITSDEWNQLCDILVAEYGALKRVRADRTGQRIRRLARHMKLSRSDVALLELMLCYETQPVVESMADEILCHHRFGRLHRQLFSLGNRGLSYALGVSMGTLCRRLATDAPLVRSGLVSVDDDGDAVPEGDVSITLAASEACELPPVAFRRRARRQGR